MLASGPVSVSVLLISEFLGSCCEEELVAGTIRSSQSKSIELENAFEVREQHLDLFAESSRYSTFPRLCNLAGHITSAFVD